MQAIRTPHLRLHASGLRELALSRNAIRSAHRRPSLANSIAVGGTGLSLVGRLPASSRDLTISHLESRRNQRERVLILGSGWGGYTIARGLDPKKYQAVVVSPRNYFAFTPLLASTSVGTLEFRTALEPVRSRRSKVNYFQGWADGIDFQRKTVTVEEAVDDPRQGLAPTGERDMHELKQGRGENHEVKKGQLFELDYDKLIITVGCYSQTFGTKGVRENALFLKDVGDARRIRSRILACFEAAALPTTTEEMRRTLLNFAVVGGGPTGIEFSAELHDIITEDLAKIYPELLPYHKITVYDVAEKVLPMFDEQLAKYAMDTFKREGISIKTSHHVEELKKGLPERMGMLKAHGSFTLKVKEEGEVGVGMVVWSTGLMMNPFVEKALREVPRLPPGSMKIIKPGHEDIDQVGWVVKKADKSGSILTDDRLRVKVVAKGQSENRPEAVLNDVFALGDCAILEGTTYPATAQVASQKAVWLAKRLNKGDFDCAPFSWKNLGVMAYIGNWNALLQGGGGNWSNFFASGRGAWILWRGAYLTKSVSWRNKILIPTYWFINWLFGRDINRF